MEYFNTVRIVFENNRAASDSRKSVLASLDTVDSQSYGYSENVNFGKIFRENVSFDGDRTFSIEEQSWCGFATPEDSLQLIPEMAKNIAVRNREVPFFISSSNSSTYADSEIELRYRDSVITVKTAYYPQGKDDDMLCCPECGEEIVSVSDYEEGKLYVCPECMEECNLEEQYVEACPVEEQKTIMI